MKRILLTTAVALCLSASMLAAPAWCAEKWRVSYFYDKGDSDLVINDLQFSSLNHGIAVGYLNEKGKTKPVSVSTWDGGAHWTVANLRDVPVSLSFVNENLGWMVTPKAIWQTTDGGREWHDLPRSPKQLMKVLFIDESHGFAVGGSKLAFQTDDGGKTWLPIAAAAEPKTDTDRTVYNNIAFVNGKVGIISGFNIPLRPGEDGKPDWLDPKQSSARREWPHLSIMLDTRDGGKTWQASTSSMFGRITRGLFLPDGRGLGLIEFTDTFKWPSEVHSIDGLTGKSSIVYNATDRAITDAVLLPSGTAYLAGVEVVGQMQHSPIPRKLKILKSGNLSDWEEMDVDYRANAVRAILSAPKDGPPWVATDNGMILKLADK